MTSYLKHSEHLPDEESLYEEKADASLAKLWKKVQDEQYKYHPAPDSEGTFERIDVVRGGFRRDVLNSDQFT